MILSVVKAREIGEALLDAAEAATKDNKCQTVVLINDIAVSIPMDNYNDEYEHIAHIVRS